MKKISSFIFKLINWKIVGQLPKEKKFIVVVAPHTSNWDFIIGLLCRFILGVKIHYYAKKQLFFFPLGIFLKAVGGFPLDRSKPGNTVEQAAQLFKEHEELAIAITPEGTRGPVVRWKEGFYHIACKAEVPIVMVAMDYQAREIRISQPYWPSGDIAHDFPEILDYFRGVRGKHAKNIPEYQPKKSKK